MVLVMEIVWRERPDGKKTMIQQSEDRVDEILMDVKKSDDNEFSLTFSWRKNR